MLHGTKFPYSFLSLPLNSGIDVPTMCRKYVIATNSIVLRLCRAHILAFINSQTQRQHTAYRESYFVDFIFKVKCTQLIIINKWNYTLFNFNILITDGNAIECARLLLLWIQFFLFFASSKPNARRWHSALAKYYYSISWCCAAMAAFNVSACVGSASVNVIIV